MESTLIQVLITTIINIVIYKLFKSTIDKIMDAIGRAITATLNKKFTLKTVLLNFFMFILIPNLLIIISIYLPLNKQYVVLFTALAGVQIIIYSVYATVYYLNIRLNKIIKELE